MKYRGKHYKSSSERWGKSIKRAEPFLRLLEIVVIVQLLFRGMQTN